VTFEEFRGRLADAIDIELDTYGAASRLSDDLMLDSISVFEFGLAMEELVGRELPDELLEGIQTLGEAYDWVRSVREVSP